MLSWPPHGWFPKCGPRSPGGGTGAPLVLTALLCLSADLTSSFLLIIMLFVISLSLLIGVVKVRAWLGEGEGGQDVGGRGRRPSCPHAPNSLLLGGQCWLLRGQEAGILGSLTCTLEISMLTFCSASWPHLTPWARGLGSLLKCPSQGWGEGAARWAVADHGHFGEN